MIVFELWRLYCVLKICILNAWLASKSLNVCIVWFCNPGVNASNLPQNLWMSVSSDFATQESMHRLNQSLSTQELLRIYEHRRLSSRFHTLEFYLSILSSKTSKTFGSHCLHNYNEASGNWAKTTSALEWSPFMYSKQKCLKTFSFWPKKKFPCKALSFDSAADYYM